YVARTRMANLEAIQQIDAYLAEHPGLSDPLQQRAQAKYALRDFAGTEADCNELIALDGPNLAMSYYIRGLAPAVLEKNDEAVADFREALRRDASLASRGLIELGDALMQAGRPLEAADEYGRAIALTRIIHEFLR